MTHAATQQPGSLWAHSSPVSDAHLSELRSLPSVKTQEGRYAVESRWIELVPRLAAWTQDRILTTIIAASPNPDVAQALAAIAEHESSVKATGFSGGKTKANSGIRSRLLYMDQIGLGVFQMTDIAHRAWYKRPALTRWGAQFRQQLQDASCHLSPLVSTLIVAEHFTHLYKRYGGMDQALFRYAGKPGFTYEQYSTRPQGLIQWSRRPFATRARQLFGG